MDAIESLDWGAYFNFGFTVNNHREILEIMKPAYYLGTYASVSAIALVAALLFFQQRRVRAALVTIGCFLVAFLLVEGVRLLVPRRRPPDAENWLGANDMAGSYPSASVLLFMLSTSLLVGALWNLLPGVRWRSLFVLLAALLTVWVCLSNLFLRIHFVTDVIAGLAGAALLSRLAYRSMGTSTPTMPVLSTDTGIAIGQPPIDPKP